MKPIRFIQWLGPVLVIYLCVMSAIALFINKAAEWASLLAFLGILTTIIEGAAFGGPALKRHQEVKKNGNPTMGVPS